MPLNASFTEIIVLLAIDSVSMLVAVILLSPTYGRLNVAINRKRLKGASIVISLVFLAALIIKASTSLLL